MASKGPPTWLELIARPQLSKVMHRLVTARTPGPILRYATRTFSRIYGVEVDEAEQPIDRYETFQAFFTRRLKPGLRPIVTDADTVPSPADGRLSAFGKLGHGTLVQAKGVEYSLDALLGASADAEPYRGGSYAVVYLAPYNYHRVHTMCAGKLTHWRYVPGALYPVNRLGIEHVPGLFARNERIIGHFDSEFGRCALVMVGATFVGHMTVAFADIASNAGQPASGRVDLSAPVELQRGDEFGVFEMGSTVVMVFDRDDLEPAITLGDAIRVGEPALRTRRAAGAARGADTE